MRQLIKTYEAWDMEIEEFHCSVTVWKEGDNYYQLSHSGRGGNFNVESLPRPNPIPIELFKGRWKPSLTECSYPLPADSYLKSPAIVLPEGYDASIGANGDLSSCIAPGDNMVAEAEIYEILKQHPHPNICVYHGCVREGEYLTAICLKRYQRSLGDAVESGASLDRDVVLDGISKGLRFLHDTLRLAHNDINPTNIMLDDKGAPVIIDFDSCVRIGQELERKGGTFGWVRSPEPQISAEENDIYAVSLIAQYMDGKILNGLPIPPDSSI